MRVPSHYGMRSHLSAVGGSKNEGFIDSVGAFELRDFNYCGIGQSDERHK
jgi:hypothetical protein